MKKRIVSIELLRILAMMMVVMLHYLSKEDCLPLSQRNSAGGPISHGFWRRFPSWL